MSAALLLGVAMSAFGADIVGTVADPGGAPIPGVTVSAASKTGTQVATATSDSHGRYAMQGIQPGTYRLNAHGQSAVSYVGENGLTVDWGVSPTAPTIATAHEGTGSGAEQSPVGIENPIAAADKMNPPPGCKGMPGPPCGPKSKKK
jgi:hypothetical protein